MIRRAAALTVLSQFLFIATPDLQSAEDRRTAVLNDRKEVQARGEWIYNDLPSATKEARNTGKPLLVVIRCIP